jgi:hypothetical protein
MLRQDGRERRSPVAPGSWLLGASREILPCSSRASRTVPWTLIFLALAADRPSKVCSA